MRKCMAGNQAACQDCPLTNQKRGCPLEMRLLTNQRRGMSLSEARHADQLVVGGGASITSDSDHRPVSWKATTSTTNRYPGSWAYLGMTFLLLTFMSCHPVLGIEGDIFPVNDIIEVGTNLNITCTLRNESGAELEVPTSRDIVWFKDAAIIPPDDYHIVNDTVSSISIVNATLMDTATYYCTLNQDTDVSDYLSSTLQVGYKPQPATSLTCASHNIYDYYCEWDPVPTHIVNESHTFQFIFDRTWKDCPDLVSPSKCFISRYEHKGSNQEIKVVSSNNLGDDATKSIYFNPDTETIPLPPRNLAVSARSSTVLFATWDPPAEWETFLTSLLVYRLHWASQYNPQEWLGELTCNSAPCEIRQLDPYTEYVVEVGSQYKSNKDNAWGDWSDPVEGRTDEAAPIGTVQDLQSSDLNGTSEYDRNVLISWQTVPEREQRGPILGYSVTVTPYSSCLEQQIINDTVNKTEVIVEELEKFCSYTVMITAFNSVGPGPVEDEKIQDMTTNPLPPSVVEAETLSHQSVLVTWNKPTPVQGYISYYTVHWIKARGQDLGQSRQVNASNLSYRVDGLEGYVLYSFKVSVTNRIGVSGWSREEQTTTEEWIPEASPTNVTVDPITNDPNSLLVNWIDVSEEDAHGQIQGHHLYYCRVAEESLSVPLCSLSVFDCLEKQERKTFSKALQKPVTLTSLAPFSHYLIWSSAFTSAGEGPRSECPSSGRTSEGTPSQPLNVSVTWSNSTSIGLTWSPPMEKNGIIRNYTILVKSNTSAEQQEFYTGGVQSYLVEGLYGYIHYTLQVRACTTTCGAASDEVYQHTDIGVPEQPENLDIQPTSHNVVTLSWDPPVHPNGPIDYYLVSYRHAEEPSTASPVVVHIRSASTTTTLANGIGEWFQTTRLTMKIEVDCSQAPFLFQVVAVNFLEGSPSVGEAAESVVSECIALETTISPLIWLILPCGVILLAILLMSFWHVQSKLGKSWPDPVYTDMVKNKKDMHPLPRPKRVEKEEFDAIQIDCPPDVTEVRVAEEFPSQPYHCTMQTSRTDPLTNSINIKSEIGGKQAYLRTVSIDSGVPPSPQDHLDFSSSEDVFDPDCDEVGWVHDTYSFGNPKVMLSHTGLGGGHLPKRSVSLSSSDGYGVLPAIEENKCMDPIMEKIPGGKRAIAVSASTSTNADDYDDDDEDDMDEVNYSRISKLSSPLRQPQGAFKDQCASMNQNRPDSPVEGYVKDSSEQIKSCHDRGEHIMASDSGYIRNDMAYMKFGLNEVTQETTFKSEPDDDYVPGPMTYSVLAVPQVRQGEQSLTSKYVSEESLAYTKLGMTPEVTGKEIVQSCSSTVALVEHPSSQSEAIGYVKLGQDSPGEDMPEEQVKSSWNDMSDYVRGVDLHKMLANERKLSVSPGSTTSPIYNQGEIVKVESQDCQDFTLDVTRGKRSRKQAVRSRTDSSSSSSGYGSDNRGQVSGYVVVSNQPKEQSDNYANLAFASSESETDSDVDIKSEKAVHPEDEHEIVKCVESVSAGCSKSKDGDTSYVEYISNDGFGVGFVNDYPISDPSEDKDSIGFSDSITPCLQTKEQSSFPKGHRKGGCKIIPGYVSYNAVLGADMTGNITPGVERLLSPGTRRDASKPDIYQVPDIICRELDTDSAGHETAEGDDGYVPFGGDDGYVLRVLDGSETKEKYMPMSPIKKTRIEEDCL